MDWISFNTSFQQFHVVDQCFFVHELVHFVLIYLDLSKLFFWEHMKMICSSSLAIPWGRSGLCRNKYIQWNVYCSSRLWIGTCCKWVYICARVQFSMPSYLKFSRYALSIDFSLKNGKAEYKILQSYAQIRNFHFTKYFLHFSINFEKKFWGYCISAFFITTFVITYCLPCYSLPSRLMILMPF